MSDPQPTPDRVEQLRDKVQARLAQLGREEVLVGIDPMRTLRWEEARDDLVGILAAENDHWRGLVETATRIIREAKDDYDQRIECASSPERAEKFNQRAWALTGVLAEFAAAGLLAGPPIAERVEVVEPEQIRHAQMLADSDACDQPVVVPVWESDVEW